MLTLDLLTLLVMIGTFALLLVKFKLPSGFCLIIASVIGLACGVAIHFKDGLTFDVRYLIEGGFGYIDNLLVIVCAMLFIKGLEANGGLDYATSFLVKKFKKFPTLLLLIFMVMLLLPGMVTGSSTAAVVSVGIIITPVLVKMGIPKQKVAGFVGLGAILGMVAPPINIPVMVICDVVDIAYSGFDIPLLILTIPMALLGTLYFSRDINLKEIGKQEGKENKKENIIITILLSLIVLVFLVVFLYNLLILKDSETGKLSINPTISIKNDVNSDASLYFRYLVLVIICCGICGFITWAFKPHCAEIDLDNVKGSINLDINKEISWTCLIPLFVIVALFIAQSIFPKAVGKLGTPLLFVIAFIPSLFVGKKFNVLKACDQAVERSIAIFCLLMGVGMFIEVLTVTGARGWIVANILTLLTLSKVALFVALAASLSAFGGISSFASASIFGGPFVMVLQGKYGFIEVASACSLIAALGEFLPPTAVSSRLATKNVNDFIKNDSKDCEEVGYMTTTKASLFPLASTLVWAMLIIMVCSVCTK